MANREFEIQEVVGGQEVYIMRCGFFVFEDSDTVRLMWHCRSNHEMDTMVRTATELIRRVENSFLFGKLSLRNEILRFSGDF